MLSSLAYSIWYLILLFVAFTSNLKPPTTPPGLFVTVADVLELKQL